MYPYSNSLPLRSHYVRMMLCIFFLSLAIAFSLDAQTLNLFEPISVDAQTASARLQSASRRAEQAFSKYSLLSLRQDAFRQMLSRKQQNLTLALPIQGRAVNISLQPYNPFSRNATFTAKTSSGEVPIALDDDFMLYRGTIDGEKSSQVNMSVSGGKVLLTLNSGGQTLTIESVPSSEETSSPNTSDENDGVYALYSSDDLKQARTFSCDAPDVEQDHDHTTQQSSKNGAQLQSAQRLEAEIAIVIDYATYQALGSSQSQATQYAAAVIAAVSQIYERDINTQLLVSHVQVWTTPDPYAGLNTTGSVLTSMQNIWSTTQGSINRDLAHLLSSRTLGGGVAYLNALCSRNVGYGVSANLRAAFPIDPGWTTIVVAHELGHNFGSPHTHSCSWAGGPLDRCAIQPGETCIPAVVRSRGTIMSYCHTLSGGISNIDVMFHPQCAALMRTRAEAASCLTAPGVVTPTATITSFSPASGGQGTVVTISGTNLTNVSAVRFGGVAAQSFTVNSPTSITARVAAGASGVIQVVTANNTALSAQQFTFTLPPASIASFSPTSAGQGVPVIITGAGFANVTAVRFGNRNAAFYTVNSSTQITAVVGAGASGTVQVVTAQGTATSAQNFTFLAPLPPASISSFSPTSGVRGTSVVITGTNFTNVSAVRFGGVAAQSFTVNSATRITAIVGAGATGTVQVATLANTAFSSQAFSFSGATNGGGNGGQQLSAISSFSPVSGAVGTAILITGSGFNLASAVRIGGVNAAYFTVLDDTRITAIVGQSGATGAIQVVTPTNTATSSQSFTVTGTNNGNGGNGSNGGNGGNGGQQLAVITSISPTRGGRGTSVVILGTNFQNASVVRFGGVEAQSFTINSPTQITAIVGVGATGAVEVVTPTNTPASSQIFTFPSGVQPTTSALSFPALRINNFFAMNLSLQNTASTGFVFRSAAIIGADASDFTIISNSHVVGTTLGGGETQTLSIRYRPSVSRSRSAIIRLTYDGQAEPIEVLLTGEVDTSTLLSVSPSALTLPRTRVGDASTPIAYEIQGWSITSAIGLSVSGDIQIALSSTGTWQSRLEIPAPPRQDTSAFRAVVWVRFSPRQDGTVEGRITHWSGNSVAVLPIIGFTQRAFITHEPELRLGTIPFGQSTVASYFLRVTNIDAPLSVTAATGVMISMGMNGPWQNSLTLVPLENTISAPIFVRYEASAQGTFTSRITHSVGATSSSILVRADVVQPVVTFRAPQILQGIINFGYVPQRLSSTATYWLEATNVTTPITISASSGFTLALADNGSWGESLTITPQSGRLQQYIFVRFQPRWEGIFAGALTHRMNGTTATLRLLGSSLTPTLSVSASRLDFGTISKAQSASTVRSYQLQADGITRPIHVSIPQGVEASLSAHGPWLQNLMLTPISAQVHTNIFVRTTTAIIGREYRAEIVHSASENGAPIVSSVFLTANLPQNSPIANDSPVGTASLDGIAQAQSYPNPFSEETTLVWNQAESGSVRVVVSSAKGVVVRTLLLPSLPSGEQRILWDGRDENGQALASGVYAAQIVVDGKNSARRVMMVLAR